MRQQRTRWSCWRSNMSQMYMVFQTSFICQVFLWKSQKCVRLEFWNFCQKKIVKLKWDLHCLSRVSTNFNEFFRTFFSINYNWQKGQKEVLGTSSQTTKNSWKCVYIIAKQCRTPFNLTNFLAKFVKIVILQTCFLAKTCCDTLLEADVLFLLGDPPLKSEHSGQILGKA